MKLKRVDRTKDDWQKCCRWCHYYENGKCIKDNVSIEETAPVWKVAEEGHLSETLEEFFGSVKLEEFRELEYKLREWKFSEKRVKEFNELFKQCFDQWVLNHKENLMLLLTSVTKITLQMKLMMVCISMTQKSIVVRNGVSLWE